jgi:hypothetical protein
VIPHERLHKMDFEELIDLYGSLRFGSPMLANRILGAFNAFVQTAIFEEKSDEFRFLDAYRSYSTAEGISEHERLRRWFIIFILFDYTAKEIEVAIR